MKHIASTPCLPYDDKYKFSARAQALLDKWLGTTTLTKADVTTGPSGPSIQPDVSSAVGAVARVQEGTTPLGLSKRSTSSFLPANFPHSSTLSCSFQGPTVEVQAPADIPT